ncbi:MAG: CBS domain-containing protein, partial [Candidatus Omnitrophota bacterium]
MTDLITTHTNADFDALASMVAARRLYPGARLVLPGSQERAVREFMSLSEDVVRIEHEKGARLDDVKRLVVVETRSAGRIGRMAQLVGRKGVEVHLYDHHPRSEGDIPADKDIYEKAGATTTILADIIRKQGLKVTPLEATIMALGIYEDTGSLTFPTTTGRDIDIVSFLMSQGADLNTVSSYLNRELTDKELNLLARLIQSTEIHIINGIHVAIASAVSDEYVDDLSLLAHKMEEAENFNATFIIVQTKDRVQFIARSSLPFIDVSKIASHFGGGGHPTAAGSVIKGLGLAGVKARLIDHLRSHIHSDIKAKDLISGKGLQLDTEETVTSAREKIAAACVEYAAVRGRKSMEGVASLRDIEKAISRGFGHARLKGYMSCKLFPVKPDTSIYAIQDIMQQKNVGCVPVIGNRKFLGLVTRTDLLRTFHGRLFGEPASGEKEDESRFTVDLTPKIKRAFPGKVAELLRFSGRIAAEMGFKAFAVGGFVRDLILGVENYDIDLVIEGSAIDF